jgi:hypothetical protein
MAKVFVKGHKKKGGRVKGTPNKKTLLLDTFATLVAQEGMDKFLREMKKLKGSAYVKSYLAIFEYVKPKLARTEHTGQGGGPIAVDNQFSQLPTHDLKAIVAAARAAAASKPADSPGGKS